MKITKFLLALGMVMSAGLAHATCIDQTGGLIGQRSPGNVVNLGNDILNPAGTTDPVSDAGAAGRK